MIDAFSYILMHSDRKIKLELSFSDAKKYRQIPVSYLIEKLSVLNFIAVFVGEIPTRIEPYS